MLSSFLLEVGLVLFASNHGMTYVFVCMDQHILACEKHGRLCEGKEGTSTNGVPVGDAW